MSIIEKRKQTAKTNNEIMEAIKSVESDVSLSPIGKVDKINPLYDKVKNNYNWLLDEVVKSK